MENKKKFRDWISWLLLGIVLIVIYKLFENFNSIGIAISNFVKLLMPFIIGILIAYILYIPEKKIEECYRKNKLLKKRARPIAIFTIYLIVAIIIFILVNVILPPIKTSIAELTNNLPGYYNTLKNVIEEIPSEYEFIKTTANDIVNQASGIDFKEYLSMENITGYIKGVINVASGVFDVFVAVIISIYALAERTNILKFLKKCTASLFNEETYNNIAKYFRQTNKIFFGFISGQVIDAFLIGIITTIAMAIMKVKYAALLGAFIGTFNLIPFFGAIVAVAIAIFITICTGGISKAILLAIVVIILQQIDANIINPKILGDKLSISPMLVIFAVAIGGAYFGVLGMFLAVPIATVLKVILNDFLDNKVIKKSNK